MAIPKLNKLLAQGISEYGILEYNEVQEKLIPRILGGASFYLQTAKDDSDSAEAMSDSSAIALAKSDKSEQLDAMIIGILQRLNYSQPDAPRALIMVSSVEESMALLPKFKQLAKHMDLKIHLAHEDGILDNQNMAIYAGADIIIATPKRLLKLYFQCGINVNKIQTLVLYNASRIFDARLHVEIDRITDSLPKFQSLVFTEELNDKLKKACGKFMKTAVVI